MDQNQNQVTPMPDGRDNTTPTHVNTIAEEDLAIIRYNSTVRLFHLFPHSRSSRRAINTTVKYYIAHLFHLPDPVFPFELAHCQRRLLYSTRIVLIQKKIEGVTSHAPWRRASTRSRSKSANQSHSYSQPCLDQVLNKIITIPCPRESSN